MKKGISLVGLIGIIFCVIIVVVIIRNITSSTTDKSKINNQENIVENETTKQVEKFSLLDLTDNGLGPTETLADIRETFGEMKQTDTYVETATSENVEKYVNSSGNMNFVIRNNKLATCIITGGDFSIRGVKIGDTEEKLLTSFYKEDEEKDVTSDDGLSIGKYLYGSFRVNDLEDVKTKDKVEYAYINKENSNDENKSYDYLIQYVCIEPPFVEDYASIYDKIACIEYQIKDGVIVGFATQVLPWDNN